jgi:cation transport ATPase
MHCASCAGTIEKLSALASMHSVRINFAEDTGTVEFDPSYSARRDLRSSARKPGYTPLAGGAAGAQRSPAGALLGIFPPLSLFDHGLHVVDAFRAATHTLKLSLQSSSSPPASPSTAAPEFAEKPLGSMDVLVALSITAAYGYSCWRPSTSSASPARFFSRRAPC